jgi:4-diphosphocytidyl-2C-methyl-D-erythritol kinase
MEALKVWARGKMNLSIDVLKNRVDGYHGVEIMIKTRELFYTTTSQKISQEGISTK